MVKTHNVTKGIRQQAAGAHPLYTLVDLKGGGQLVELMKFANRSKNYTKLDQAIRESVQPFVYNDGKGMAVPVSEIVRERIGTRDNHEKPASKTPWWQSLTSINWLWKKNKVEDLQKDSTYLTNNGELEVIV